MAQPTKTIEILIFAVQNVTVRKKVKLPKGTRYTKARIVIHTDFSQSDIDVIYN